MNFIHHHVLYIFLGLCKSRGEGGRDAQNAWGQHMENLKEIIYYKDISIDGKIYCIRLAYNMI
jgi:hypothetical protein